MQNAAFAAAGLEWEYVLRDVLPEELEAAAHPAKVDYLYFVRKPDCRSHFFTADVNAFLNYTRKGLTNC